MPMSHLEEMREAISCHIDGRLPERQRFELEQHLAGCTACREELATMQATVALLGRTPAVRAPRSFALPVTARRSPVVVALPWMQRVATLAAALLLLVLGADAMSGTVGQRATAPAPAARNLEYLSQPLADRGAAPSASEVAPQAPREADAAMPAAAGAAPAAQPVPAATAAPAAAKPTTAPAAAKPTTAPAAAPTRAVPAPTRAAAVAQSEEQAKALASPSPVPLAAAPAAPTTAAARAATAVAPPALAAPGQAPADTAASAAPAAAAGPPPSPADQRKDPAAPATIAGEDEREMKQDGRAVQEPVADRTLPAVRLIEGALALVLLGAGLLTVLGRRALRG